MVCSKCNKFNMSENEECVYCGARLDKNPGAASFKSFVGNASDNQGLAEDDLLTKNTADNFFTDATVKINADDIEMFKKAVVVDEIKTDTDYQPLMDDADLAGNDQVFMSFEEDIELNQKILPEAEDEIKLSKKERITFRNTALMAIILAVLIDAILVICMVVCFKIMSSRIVNVDYKQGEVVCEWNADASADFDCKL